MTATRFPVEASHILMFARAIADPNPVYADEAYAKGTECGGVIAPPTFAIAAAQFDPDYPLRPKPDRPWFGSGREPSGRVRGSAGSSGSSGAGGGAGAGAGGGGLHAEQHFEYHRPLRPGDVLRAETKPGRRWEKQGRRGGKLLFGETVTEHRDQHGELVVTARSVGVRTERVPQE
jgi:acyl dehydratase